MQNYEEMILTLGIGETPKQRFEDLISKLSKLEQAKTFLKGLYLTQDDATVGNLRSAINANYETINRKN